MPWDVVIDPLALLALAGFGIRAWRRFDKKFAQFHEDWNGTPGRPGVPPRAGVMERLSMIEVAQVDMRGDVENIKKKLEQQK